MPEGELAKRIEKLEEEGKDFCKFPDTCAFQLARY